LSIGVLLKRDASVYLGELAKGSERRLELPAVGVRIQIREEPRNDVKGPARPSDATKRKAERSKGKKIAACETGVQIPEDSFFCPRFFCLNFVKPRYE
jgi:hypothetical protein